MRRRWRGIYAAKERPRFNPLIAHARQFRIALAPRACSTTPRWKLAEAFWPGPLTLVVPVAPTCTISDLARAGLDSVGLRVPAHPLAHALLQQAGRPVAAPSANRSGRVSPTDADHVLGDLDGRIEAVLDGGATQVGVESTIVACLGGTPRLLRPGGVPREAIEALIGMKLEGGPEAGAKPLAPGMLASHYAPRAQVRLNATSIRPGEAALAVRRGDPRGRRGSPRRPESQQKRRPRRGRRSSVLLSQTPRRLGRSDHRGEPDSRNRVSARPSTTACGAPLRSDRRPA